MSSLPKPCRIRFVGAWLISAQLLDFKSKIVGNRLVQLQDVPTEKILMSSFIYTGKVRRCSLK